MQKPVTIIGVMALAVVTLLTAGLSFACGGSSGQAAPPAPTDVPTAAAPAAADGATTTHVTLSEWKIDAPTTLKAGDVTFDVKNAGTTPHEFVVIKSDASPGSFPVISGGKFDEEAAGESPGETGDIDVGGEKTVTLHLDPGTYVFVCNLPGHYMSGMRGTFTVE